MRLNWGARVHRHRSAEGSGRSCACLRLRGGEGGCRVVSAAVRERLQNIISTALSRKSVSSTCRDDVFELPCVCAGMWTNQEPCHIDVPKRHLNRASRQIRFERTSKRRFRTVLMRANAKPCPHPRGENPSCGARRYAPHTRPCLFRAHAHPVARRATHTQGRYGPRIAVGPPCISISISCSQPQKLENGACAACRCPVIYILALRSAGTSIGMSSNGRTADSGSVNGGSTPSIPANVCPLQSSWPVRLAVQDAALSRRRSPVRIWYGLPRASGTLRVPYIYGPFV